MSHSITMELWSEDDGCHMPVQLPAHYEVCPRCDGRGTQCNLGAMTGDEYREVCDGDPDFPEDYKQGMYSVPCSECGGLRVVSEVDLDRLDSTTKARVEAEYQARAEDAAERRYQQRYGF